MIGEDGRGTPPRRNLVERNDDGTLTKETLKRAMKAFRKRLKLHRLDDESQLGHDPLSKGEKSMITAVIPPEQYPQEVWDRLVELGRLNSIGHGLYELVQL
ncbi:MAG: hypothetical protein QF412_14160 [Planctomycetota bacterium]|nr:hypothetical protein [Planctomycetota bacterium]